MLYRFLRDSVVAFEAEIARWTVLTEESSPTRNPQHSSGYVDFAWILMASS